MKIKLSEQFNELEARGNTRWYEMRAHLESDMLMDIEHVEYHLNDPSVKTPIIVSANQDNKFEIHAKSWKEFSVFARIKFKDPSIDPITIQGEE